MLRPSCKFLDIDLELNIDLVLNEGVQIVNEQIGIHAGVSTIHSH